MTEVDRLNRLLLEVRTSLLDKAKRSAGSSSSAAAKSESLGRKEPELTPAQLRQSVVDSLRALGPITDQNRREARRQFVQWTLLGEFGFEMANDPEFGRLCGQVLEAFADSAELSERLDGMLTALSAQAAR